MAADGSYSYTLGETQPEATNVAQLAAGEQQTDTFTYTVADDQNQTSTADLIITITGTDDAPVITSAAQSGQVSEGDGQPAASRTATGQVTYSDVDTGDTHSFSIDTAAAYGVASVDADGTWHYTVTDAGAVDALGQGDTLGDSFTVKVADNNGGFATQTVAITITGTNDAPAITSAPQSGHVSEGDGQPASSRTATGQVTYSDVDTGDSHSFSIDTAATYGVASVDADGTWHYTVTDAGAVDALGQGDTLGDSFTVKVADNNGLFATQTVAITITGTDDAPADHLGAAERAGVRGRRAAGVEPDRNRTGDLQRRRHGRHAQLLDRHGGGIRRGERRCRRHLALHRDRCRRGRRAGAGSDAARHLHREGRRQQRPLCHADRRHHHHRHQRRAADHLGAAERAGVRGRRAAGGEPDGNRTGDLQRRRHGRHAQLLDRHGGGIRRGERRCRRHLALHRDRRRRGRRAGAGRHARRQLHREGCRQQRPLCHADRRHHHHRHRRRAGDHLGAAERAVSRRATGSRHRAGRRPDR